MKRKDHPDSLASWTLRKLEISNIDTSNYSVFFPLFFKYNTQVS